MIDWELEVSMEVQGAVNGGAVGGFASRRLIYCHGRIEGWADGGLGNPFAGKA